MLSEAEFCQACIDGDLARVRGALAESPALANASGQVAPAHRDYMKREKADGGWTALHLAAHYGKLDVVRALLEAGASVNAKATNGIGNTPLMAAVAGGKAEIVKLLLDADADTTLTDASGHTVHALADAEKRPEIATLLKKTR